MKYEEYEELEQETNYFKNVCEDYYKENNFETREISRRIYTSFDYTIEQIEEEYLDPDTKCWYYKVGTMRFVLKNGYKTIATSDNIVQLIKNYIK